MESSKNRYQIDMLNGPMWKKIIAFSLPLAATSILQQLFNSADVAVVGRFAGSSALAAVGANVANVGIFVNFLVGFSVGPNFVMAKSIGQGNTERSEKTVGTTISIAIITGLICFILGQTLTRWAMVLLSTPSEVLEQAILYFRLYLIGLPFMAIYNCGAAILRSVGDTRRPLYILITSGIVNVGLNLLFVIVCQMSVAGVAIATVISNVLCAVLVLLILSREKGILHLSIKNMKIDGIVARDILKSGVPAGVQSMVFSLSNMFIQSGINSFGADAIAGSSVALNFEYFTYDIVAGFGQATITFTGQNFGAGNLERCKRVFWITMWEGMAFTAVLCLIFVIFRNQVVLLYSTDEGVIEFAIKRMLLVMSVEFLTGFHEVSCGSLRGFGKTLWPSVFTIIGTVGFRILWLYTVFAQWNSYESLMIVYPVSWLFAAAMTSAYLVYVYKKAKKRIG